MCQYVIYFKRQVLFSERDVHTHWCTWCIFHCRYWLTIGLNWGFPICFDRCSIFDVAFALQLMFHPSKVPLIFLWRPQQVLAEDVHTQEPSSNEADIQPSLSDYLWSWLKLRCTTRVFLWSVSLYQWFRYEVMFMSVHTLRVCCAGCAENGNTPGWHNKDRLLCQ